MLVMSAREALEERDEEEHERGRREARDDEDRVEAEVGRRHLLQEAGDSARLRRARLARRVMRHPVAVLVPTLAILLVLGLRFALALGCGGGPASGAGGYR